MPSLCETETSLSTVQTPCLVVDRTKVERNIARLAGRLAGTGVTLRPHLKTIKSVEAARLVLSRPDGPATVSTLKEAQEFGRRGITDLLYSVQVSPQKLAQISQLHREGIDLKVLVDSMEMARAVAAHGRANGRAIPTLIEIDVDGHRSGIPLDDQERLLDVAKALMEEGGDLRGVMTHAGDSYSFADPGALAEAAEVERLGALRMAKVLRSHGLPCPVVSVGSTPTAFSARSYEGVTEVRAGVFLFFDLFQSGVGVCGIDDIALSVLTTVVGRRDEKGWLITDAGWMALSGDNGTSKQTVNQHLGLVCDIDGRPFGNLVVLKANQEHGIIGVRPGSNSTMPDIPIGARLRILPNHACATAAQHDRYHVVSNDQQVQAVWPRFNGWRVDERAPGSIAIVDEKTIGRVATRKLVYDAVREGLIALAKGDAELFPAVSAIGPAPDTTMSVKSGVSRKDGLIGLKVGTYWPGNRKRGLASHGSTTLLLDKETGAPRALLNARALNGLRTAAANAAATDKLASPDADTLAVLGAGHQAVCEVRAICDVRRIKRLRIWNRTPAQAQAFAALMADLGLESILVLADADEAVAEADIITTVTASRAPLFSASRVRPGSHISAMGADKPGKQELDPALFDKSLLFADEPAQSVRIGEFQHITDAKTRAGIIPLGRALSGDHPGRTSPKQITIFDSSGVAIQDLMTAEAVLQELEARQQLVDVDF